MRIFRWIINSELTFEPSGDTGWTAFGIGYNSYENTNYRYKIYFYPEARWISMVRYTISTGASEILWHIEGVIG